mgnify:FL=1
MFFEGDGLTEIQIASECGSVMSELLAGDTAILNQALDRMNSFVLGLDSKMKQYRFRCTPLALTHIHLCNCIVIIVIIHKYSVTVRMKFVELIF